MEERLRRHGEPSRDVGRCVEGGVEERESALIRAARGVREQSMQRYESKAAASSITSSSSMKEAAAAGRKVAG